MLKTISSNMFKQLILGFLFFTLNACSAQKQNTMRTFDIETFNEHKNPNNDE